MGRKESNQTKRVFSLPDEIDILFIVTAAGKSFGELALINADCVRNASIIADEVTDLLIVNRELYSRSLKVI